LDIYKICKKKKISIIEDACHAIGTKYNIKKKHYNVGACAHSDISTLSFHSIKNITTGEGGCILTNNKKVFDFCKILRSHGIQNKNRKNQPWLYDAVFLSANHRITDFQSSLGISQLKKLNNFYIKKKKLYKIYVNTFEKYKFFFKPLKKNSNCKSHWHLFPILFNHKFIYLRNKLYFFLRKNYVLAQINYIPLYKHSIYKKYYDSVLHKNSEYFYKRILSMPFHTSLKIKDVKKVFSLIDIFFKQIKF